MKQNKFRPMNRRPSAAGRFWERRVTAAPKKRRMREMGEFEDPTLDPMVDADIDGMNDLQSEIDSIASGFDDDMILDEAEGEEEAPEGDEEEMETEEEAFYREADEEPEETEEEPEEESFFREDDLIDTADTVAPSVSAEDQALMVAEKKLRKSISEGQKRLAMIQRKRKFLAQEKRKRVLASKKRRGF